jgi:hypothetical protein
LGREGNPAMVGEIETRGETNIVDNALLDIRFEFKEDNVYYCHGYWFKGFG